MLYNDDKVEVGRSTDGEESGGVDKKLEGRSAKKMSFFKEEIEIIPISHDSAYQSLDYSE